MKTNQFFRMTALVLMALLDGASPSWGASWGYSRSGITDDGGGTYAFYSQNHDLNGYYAYNLYAFQTNKVLDYANDQLCWEYTFRFCPPKITPNNIMAEGEVLLLRSDGSSLTIGSWKKARNSGDITFTRTNWGLYPTINKPVLSEDKRELTVQIFPGAYTEEYARVAFKAHYVYRDEWDFGWFQYEKNQNMSNVSESSPLPKLSYRWSEDGHIVAKGTNSPDKIDKTPYRYQQYEVRSLYCQDNGKVDTYYHMFFINDRWVNISNRKNGKLDFEYTFNVSPNGWANSSNFYPTVAYCIRSQAEADFNNNSDICNITQPWTSAVVQPFTRPLSVTAEFDKWHKKNTIKWTRNERVKVPKSETATEDLDCSFDGKWYVIRYDRGTQATDYTLVGSLDGNSTTLEMVDAEAEYDHDYVYRVVFLPSPFESKYKNQLASLPCEGSTHQNTDLWEEARVNTQLELPIRLAQDRTYEDAVRLVWEYCADPSAQNWTIEYSPVGENQWRTLDNSLAIDPERSVASFDTNGSVCDLVDYRIKTTYVGREFYSNVVTGNLPAGSYISEVKASTGTEEKTVVVKWKIVRADATNDIYYRVLRRAVGTEEWTLLTDEIHGKESEYTYIDDRPLAGSYYEYSVQAYGAKCDEQLVQTDEVITPGFSQARGTITGHISYGTGTAVAGARVNLIKSSADESTDQPQFLSRYIEGEGKGLMWKADSAKYAKVLNGQQPATLQFWAKPSNDGSGQMALATLNGALQLGVKRIGDNVTYQTTVSVSKPVSEALKLTADTGTENTTGEGYAKLVDGDISTKWCTSTKVNGVYLCEFHSAGTVMVTGYKLTTGNDNTKYNGRNPKSWVLKAKLHAEDAWETIATVSNDHVLHDLNQTTYTYATDKKGVYQYFRFEVSDNVSSDHEVMQLSELSLIADDTPVMDIANVQTKERLAGTTDQDYCLYAVDLSSGDPNKYSVTEFQNLTFSSSDFTHVAAVYHKGKWKFYLGTDSLLTDSITVASSDWKACPAADMNTLAIGGTYQTVCSAFKGLVDDIRLWSRALTQKQIETNYTRIQSGSEDGLVLYWPLDEGLSVVNYAFDVARQDGIYLLNHPEVGVNARPRAEVPRWLSLYGLTDKEGDYIIKGIPFQQGGTNYKLAPVLGIHEFNPNTRSMFISPTSLTANNIDFEDVSSFPMSGHIYYAGTNIPAEGIQFYVDGDLVTAGGEVQKTDVNGFYQISVPIGEHFVQAKLEGHTMVDGGRFPTKGLHNFDRAMQYDFADSTLVNFVGRVGGGVRNDTLAVGFAESKNNIGMATVTLRLNNESFSFNCADDHISDATAQRTWQSDTTSIASQAWTGVGSDSKYIFIRTDARTGEFSAKLPPLKYITKSIRLDNNADIEFNSLPEIDLTSVKKQMTDSLKQVTENGDSVWNYYKYNSKMVRSYFAKPEVDMWQMKGDGAFGEKELKDYAVSSTETTDITNIWTRQEDGSIKYNYQFPVFARKKQYVFALHGYEVYTNYDSGQAVADTIPMNGQVLTIANEMSDEQDVVARVIDPNLTNLKAGDIYNLKRNQVRLDDDGKNEVTFTTGAPNITAPYTRQFSMSFERNKRTYVGPLINGVVLGELTNGNNFVTDGPDHVTMVLRDPPGSKGKTTWKTGTTYTTIDYKTDGVYWDQSVLFDLIWGADLKTAIGLGVAIISGSKATTTVNTGIKSSFSWQWKDDKTYVYTTAENISTSTGSKYCGSNGDIFIGQSHNYIIGTCRKLGFHREADGIILGLREAVSINDSIKTDFMYSALEIKETMIPKIEDARNMLLEYMDSTSAVGYQNTSDKDVYLTWLTKDNPRYGQEGTYVWKRNPKDQTQDMVLHYNESMRLWKDRLRENERDKVEAAQDPSYYKENRSFDGGVSYTYSERRDTTRTSTTTENAKVGYAFDLKTQFSVNAAATFGTNINFKEEIGYTGNRTKGDSLDNVKSYIEFDYDLNDGNPGTDFTVDILRSPRGWSDIFLLRGGQSYNPYEGKEYAQYYEPEKKHVISYGTEQMEQPAIAISTDGVVGAKTARLTDVPAGQMGQFTLHLSNNNTTNQPFDMTYNLAVQEHTDTLGLEILMDGLPLNGRSVWVQQRETVKKVITVRQTDQSILDFKGIAIRFQSQYQPLKINDEVTFDVSFKPSSSPIDMVITDPVLNIETLERNKGNLELKLTNFDRQFKGMTKVGVEYRFEGSTTWTRPSELTFAVNAADAEKDHLQVLPSEGDLRLQYDMSSDTNYPQGTYTFRAYTTTMYGSEPVNVYSDEIKVVKDNVRPRSLTTPTPANGILRYGDDLSIEFNEDIVPGYVSDKNIIVTAKLNNQPVKHEVAKIIRPYGDDQCTINPIFLNGDFSVDFWMLWQYKGTILRHGNQFALGLDAEGHIVVTIVGTQYVSKEVLPKNQWTFFVLSYNSTNATFSALAKYGDKTAHLFTDEPVDNIAQQAVSYSEDNYLYLGDMDGAIHDLCLFNICQNLDEAELTMYQAKDSYVYGLCNYWPMNEGYGYVAADTRHTHDFSVNDSWRIDNLNYSLNLQDTQGVQVDISQINTGIGDSYAIEMWCNLAYDVEYNEQMLFETGSVPSNRLALYINKQQDWVLHYGGKEQVVVDHEDSPYFPVWNHVALNVVRGQAASLYINGLRVGVIAEREVPRMEGHYMTIGRDINPFTLIDEVRIWHATLSEDRLLANMYNCIDTADVYSRGLVAYYPFEKDGKVDGVETKVKTFENMAPQGNRQLAEQLQPLGKYHIVELAPPLRNAPSERRLTATPVASERKVLINLSNTSGVTARDLEGSTLNITVDKINDMHGNQSLPIRWQAYVQLNTLKWTKDSVNIIKQYGDDYTFDVVIENRGGSTEYYYLYNMPQWLDLVDSNIIDDLPPLSTKTLRFRVNPLVAVGNYDVTIGLQGNDEILEPLRIVMKVRGEKPVWSVDPTRFENNMSIVGQIYINGILMGNSESLLAAFIGDECRGIASPKQIRGAAYVAMTVYGTAQQEVNGVMKDLDKGKPLTFRIWDASTGVAYTNVLVTVPEASAPGAAPTTVPEASASGTSTTGITFDPTQNYGTFDHPVVFTKSNSVEQPLNLRPNWNWLSLGVEPDDTKTSVVFKDLTSWNVRLKDQGNSIAYCKGVYWAGTMKEVHANTMYKMLLTRLSESSDLPQPLTVVGHQVKLAETPVTLQNGWNWIAYLPTTSMTLDRALAGANPQIGDQVKSQTGFAYYGPYGWEGNLEALESGKGYLYQSLDTQTKTFVYPAPAAASRIESGNDAARSQSSIFNIQSSIFSPVTPTDYPDNMSLVIMLTNDGEPVADAEVGAFIDGECRAAAFADVDEMTQTPLYYLLVAGEGSGQPMEIRTAIRGTVRTVCNTLTYSSDANIGTPWEPYVIDINTSTGVVALSPLTSQPSTSCWYTLQGIRLGTARPTAPGVYLYNGQKVVVKRLGTDGESE